MTFDLRADLDLIEALAVDPRAPHDALDAINRQLSEMLADCGLDPADQSHRRAFLIGYVARTALRGDATLIAAAAVRPPVVDV